MALYDDPLLEESRLLNEKKQERKAEEEKRKAEEEKQNGLIEAVAQLRKALNATILSMRFVQGRVNTDSPSDRELQRAIQHAQKAYQKWV